MTDMEFILIQRFHAAHVAAIDADTAATYARIRRKRARNDALERVLADVKKARTSRAS
jgi:hypothetical protein